MFLIEWKPIVQRQYLRGGQAIYIIHKAGFRIVSCHKCSGCIPAFRKEIAKDLVINHNIVPSKTPDFWKKHTLITATPFGDLLDWRHEFFSYHVLALTCVSLFFSDTAFLLTIWEFHIMHPAHFPVLPCLLPIPCDLPASQPQIKRGERVYFMLFKYSLEQGRTPSGQSPKENSFSPPVPLPEAINCGELHLSIPITIFKSSL